MLYARPQDRPDYLRGSMGECRTCGKNVRMSCDACGECAEDWQTPEGKSRVNRRRRKNHLKPLGFG